MSDLLELRKDITPIDLDALNHPSGYVMEDNGLIAAANAALTLGKPLLLSGEAGVGKSQFASWLADQLALAKPLKFVVKSSTDANDLFYQYDALARFHNGQALQLENRPKDSSVEKNHTHDPLHYITYNALGKALLYSLGRQGCENEGLVSDAMHAKFLEEFPAQACRSVVLIDEIDKAPRDVPNDILDEIDNYCFNVREIGNKLVTADSGKRPVVVITSNSERDLPKAFLRRCVYYHMQFPSEHMLTEIAEQRVGARYENAPGLFAEAVRLFRHLRLEDDLTLAPSVAELLDWLVDLAHDAADYAALAEHPRARSSLCTTLLKHPDDQARLNSDGEWDAWLAAVAR